MDDGGDLLVDLSTQYPATRAYSQPDYSLEDLGPKSRAADNVGVSALVLTADGYPILTQQNRRALQNNGKYVFCGSGSADFADIATARTWFGRLDLLEIVRVGMAREFCEEASLRFNPQAIELWKEIATNTLVLGYFRWTSRSGKPEFVGVAHTAARLDDIVPAKEELYALRNWKPKQIRQMSDFNRLGDEIRSLGWSVGLSSAIALHRLEEIARSPADDPVRRAVEKLLKLQSTP